MTMLTLAPETGVALYHDRQITVLDRCGSLSWPNPTVPAADVLRPLPARSLRVEQVA
jgi:putative SOS response-associated peptidase YedK